MNYSNGDVYEGEWRDDMRNGKGVMDHSDGTRCEGDWVNDLPCTKSKAAERLGTVTYPNGDRYVGELREDSKHGKGRAA